VVHHVEASLHQVRTVLVRPRGFTWAEGEVMSTEAEDLHRIIRASVHDMLDAYRIQAQAGPVSDQALERVIFRAATPIVDRLARYPAARRGALLPNIVRVLLATFLEDVAGAGRTQEKGTR
jgi:hypothetical protein